MLGGGFASIFSDGSGNCAWPFYWCPTSVSASASSCRLHDVEGSLEVVGDGGEVDLAGCLCDSAPSHPAQAITSFPCSEDFLDPAAHPVDWLVPVLELETRKNRIFSWGGGARGRC